MRWLLLLVFLFLSQFALAAGTWHVNPNHSQVRFEVDFMSVSKVEGRLDQYRGQINEAVMDEEAASFQSAELNLLVKGLTTGVSQRDKHLLGPDFFYSTLYPRFVVKLGPAKFKREVSTDVEATLTIKEVTKEVALKITYLGLKANKDNQRSAFFEATGVISRSDFSLGWNQFLTQNELLLGDRIQISATVEVNPTGERPALGQFFKLTKSERDKFMKIADLNNESLKDEQGLSDKDTLLYEAKISTLTEEVEALSRSNEVLRAEIEKVRSEAAHPKKVMPDAINFASIVVFVITMLFGLGAGIWFKWNLLKPLAMEDPKYNKLDRLSDMLLMLMILCGVGVMGWFFGLY